MSPNAGSAILFKDTRPAEKVEDHSPWKILIVDDEQFVHDVTLLVLKQFRFHKKGLKFLHAFSAEEAGKVLVEHPDIAVILLDVVMETDDAGLKFANAVREIYKNPFVRIILRTGQPGQAPESEVIEAYDIHDYKEKTELTRQKLSTALFSALRSYHDIMALEVNRQGLESLINATASMLANSSLHSFMDSILGHLIPLSSPHRVKEGQFINAFIAEIDNDAGYDAGVIVSGNGEFTQKIGDKVAVHIDVPADVLLNALHKDRYFQWKESASFYLLCDQKNKFKYIFIESLHPMPDIHSRMVKIFCSNALLIHDNLRLYEESEEDQRTLVYMLSDIAEFRSEETSNHVRRVAAYSSLLATHSGLDEKEADQVGLASTMHDLGKLAIPDAILKKPGKLNDEEREVMNKHAEYGYRMLLKSSHRKVIEMASIIAHEHHEKWDGSGYPRGLAGEEIHLYGRITALADVFDALLNKRCYKEPWSVNEVLDYINAERGKQFDPSMVDKLMNNIQDFMAIYNKFRD